MLRSHAKGRPMASPRSATPLCLCVAPVASQPAQTLLPGGCPEVQEFRSQAPLLPSPCSICRDKALLLGDRTCPLPSPFGCEASAPGPLPSLARTSSPLSPLNPRGLPLQIPPFLLSHPPASPPPPRATSRWEVSRAATLSQSPHHAALGALGLLGLKRQRCGGLGWAGGTRNPTRLQPQRLLSVLGARGGLCWLQERSSSSASTQGQNDRLEMLPLACVIV